MAYRPTPMKGDYVLPHEYGGPGRSRVPTNPYQPQIQALAGKITDPYAGDMKALAGKANTLGNTDYTAAMRKMYLEDVAQQQKRQESQMRAMGMGELSLAPDVQRDWSTRREEATTRAATTGAELQRAAYAQAQSMLQTASGQHLDFLVNQLNALVSGGSNYNQFMSMLIPLMQERGRLVGNQGLGA